MNNKTYAVFGILVIVACLLPAVTTVSAAIPRAKPGTTTGVVGIGTAGPASKAGADGIVKKIRSLCRSFRL
jgi:hypothetical protein